MAVYIWFRSRAVRKERAPSLGSLWQVKVIARARFYHMNAQVQLKILSLFHLGICDFVFC